MMVERLGNVAFCCLLRAGISEGAISGSVDTRVAVLDAMGADERSAT